MDISDGEGRHLYHDEECAVTLVALLPLSEVGYDDEEEEEEKYKDYWYYMLVSYQQMLIGAKLTLTTLHEVRKSLKLSGYDWN